MEIQEDGNGSLYVEWQQKPGIYKRAWVQHRTDEKDWAGTVRYLQVVRCNEKKGDQAEILQIFLFSTTFLISKSF